MICLSGGLKKRLAKAAGAEPSGQKRDEQLHVVVVGCTFPSQNRSLLVEVEMSKKRGPLWCKAHVEVKNAKKKRLGALLDVRMSFFSVCTRDSAPCQSKQNLKVLKQF